MEYEIICCNVIRETDAAFLFNDGTQDFWCPKSLIDNIGEINEFEDAVDVEIAVWFCEKEGLI